MILYFENDNDQSFGFVSFTAKYETTASFKGGFLFNKKGKRHNKPNRLIAPGE